MYKFKNTADLSAAIEIWSDYPKEKLIEMLCYYRGQGYTRTQASCMA